MNDNLETLKQMTESIFDTCPKHLNPLFGTWVEKAETLFESILKRIEKLENKNIIHKKLKIDDNTSGNIELWEYIKFLKKCFNNYATHKIKCSGNFYVDVQEKIRNKCDCGLDKLLEDE